MSKEKILIGTDTVSGISPEILKAISKASNSKALPYGNDIFSKECENIIKNVFEKKDLEIIPMMSGTASNSLALSSFLRSYGTVICHNDSHINKDEGGAPEFFSGGGKLLTLSNSLGKIKVNELSRKLEEINFKGKFYPVISGVSITQLAENGTMYTLDEINSISKICKINNLYLHMDGARFTNALVTLGNVSPADATWKVGVDCLSLGATKNGAMAAEVIIFFNKELAKEAKYLIKQTGHVVAKTRFITAQLNAWFKDDLWLKLAKTANKKALYLRKKLLKFNDVKVLFPTHGNEVFFEMNKSTYENLLKLKVFPNLWSKVNDNHLIVRFVTSFETTTKQIDEIINRLESSLHKY